MKQKKSKMANNAKKKRIKTKMKSQKTTPAGGKK
jgi:hypothetical protein